MKIKVTTWSDEMVSNNDYRGSLEIEVNGEKMFNFQDGEPEDANLGRDFNDCFNIVRAMKLAWQAGKDGEGFDVVEREIDDWE